MEGFSEEVRLTAHAKAPPTPPLEGAGHFPPPGSKEGMQVSGAWAVRGERRGRAVSGSASLGWPGGACSALGQRAGGCLQ